MPAACTGRAAGPRKSNPLYISRSCRAAGKTRGRAEKEAAAPPGKPAAAAASAVSCNICIRSERRADQLRLEAAILERLHDPVLVLRAERLDGHTQLHRLVAVDAVFDSVSVATTYSKALKEKGILDNSLPHEDFNDYESSSASMVHSGDNGETIGMLNRRESNSKYVLAGAGGTLSVIGILFAVFRLGQLSKRKPESDKIFPKDDNKDKW